MKPQIKLLLSRTLDHYRAALNSMSTEDGNLEALYRARCVDPRWRMKMAVRRQAWREKKSLVTQSGLR